MRLISGPVSEDGMGGGMAGGFAAAEAVILHGTFNSKGGTKCRTETEQDRGVEAAEEGEADSPTGREEIAFVRNAGMLNRISGESRVYKNSAPVAVRQ